MRIILGILFWCVYFPLIRLVVLFLFWNNRMEERERFEKKNKFEYLAHSFKEIGLKADLAFEFSSEGEYQQVAPLIDDALKSGKKIELIFFSPSVEKTIMKLASLHPNQIRYLRYPFARLLPFVPRRSLLSWVTSKTLIMVRYDLFPELLIWGLHPENTLKMVWMTFKKGDEIKVSFWKSLFVKASKANVFARSIDFETARALNQNGFVFDFRIEQIRRRLLRREEKFRTHFSLYPDYKNNLKRFNRKIILGNAWPSDLFLLSKLPAGTYVTIVPHNLSDEVLNQFRDGLKNLGREYSELNDSTTSFVPHETLIVNKKGILCEMYADFDYSYVGGGFESSIHSVLEPFVAGSSKISCGPRHHRSTEYDIAHEFGRISEVNSPEQFLEWLNHEAEIVDHDKMNALVNGYDKGRELVISC